MGVKEYGIAFAIAGKISGSFSKSFKTANDAVQGFSGQINDLNRQAANVSNVIKLRKETALSARSYLQAKEKADQLAKAMAKNGKPTQQMVADYQKAKTTVDKARSALEKKRATLKSAERAAGTNGKTLKELIARNDELARSADRARVVQAKLAKANELIAKSKDVRGIGNAQMAAAGGAALGAGAYMLKAGNNYTQALNKMQAQTGATAAEMQALSKAARELYKEGHGENFDAVTAAMVNIRQNSGMIGDELKEATRNALALNKAFSFDVNESTRAATALMKNLGVTAEEAYGLITYGAQHGANRSGDLLDILNEYSVHFKTLGLSGDQFIQSLVSGAEAGSFSIDKIGDAVKEFTIRSKDASQSTLEAYDAMGLNGAKLTKMFAAGGDSAKEAFFTTVKALNAMKDPVAKNTAGVALFGTMFEDLESGVIETMLSMEGASVDAAGSLKKVKDVIDNDLVTSLSKVKREFEMAMMPASKGMAEALTAQIPEIQKAFAKLAPILAQVGNAFVQNLPAAIAVMTGATQAAVGFATTIANNWGWIGPIVKGVVLSFLGLKAIAYLISPVLTLYKGFVLLRQGITLMRGSTLLSTAAMKAQQIAMLLWKGTMVVVTTAMKLMRGAVVAVNLAMRANPIGLVVTLLGGLVLAGVAVYKNWDTIKAKLVSLWSSFSEKFPALAQVVKNWAATVGAIIDNVKGIFSGIMNFVQNVFAGNWASAWENVKSIFSNTFGALAGIAKAPLNSIIGMVNSVIAGINSLGSVKLPDWAGGKSFGVNISSIPQLAAGGVATQPTLAMIGEGRESEAVLPLSKLDGLLGAHSGGGAVSISFSPVINVTGGGSDTYADVKRGLEEGSRNLKREIERLMNNQRRLAFV